MKKKLLGILFIFFVIFYSAFTYLNSPKITYLLKGEKCSDSKFLDNTFVLTGVNGNLTLINTNSGIDKKLNINSSWIDCLSENDRNIIIYSNINKETGLFITNKDGDIISNNIIFNNENLCIDPSIYKFNNTYFITSTEIEGNINNNDINAENGIYTVKLYESGDLKNFYYVGDIIKANNNIEDVELGSNNGNLYLLYEKEVVDKGNSSICIKESTDFGKNWSQEKELLPANCDHEPAKLIQQNDKFVLYYSCDKDNIGESYNGAKAYYSTYNLQFNCITKDNYIDLKTKSGILLYDVKEQNNKLYFLYAKNYLTDNELTIEDIKHIR